jgi:hypothetical protein
MSDLTAYAFCLFIGMVLAFVFYLLIERVIPSFKCPELPIILPLEKCCEREENSYEDDSDCVVCRSCKEWTCEVKCRACGNVIFQSACCG